ncbi:MAG: hypothetical protein NZ693_07375 [Thermoflexales bacterium]|nr:hypothetical protein [Thermoflexales bacterium]
MPADFRPCGTALAALGLALATLMPARAQAPTITMSAEAGLDGLARAGGWMPVRVRIANFGPALRGEVFTIASEQGANSVYAQSVELPTDSQREIVLYARAGRLAREVSVKLRQEGQVLVTTTARLRVLSSPTPLVLVVGETPDAFSIVRAVRGLNGDPAALAFMRLEHLPDQTAALDAADILVISSANTARLTRAQRAALKGWVLAGGHLILAGGPTAQDVVQGLDDLAPARVGLTTRTASLAALETLVSPFGGQPALPLLQQPVPVAPLEVARPEARLLAGDRELPMVVRRPVGRGTVDQLAFDPAFVSSEVRPLLAEVFAALARGSAGRAQQVGYAPREDALFTAALAAATPALMPVGVIVGLLLGYVVSVGLLNAWVLRRLRRPTLVWLAMPLLAGLFTTVVMVGGHSAYDLRPQLHRLSLWLGDAGVDIARDFSLYSVRALRRSQVSLTFDQAVGSAYVRDAEGWRSLPVHATLTTTLSFGVPNALNSLPASLDARAAFYAIGARDQPIALQATLSHTRSAGHAPVRLEGEVRNLSTRALQDCVLLAGREYQVIGDLAPQGAISAYIALTTGHPQPLVDLQAVQTKSIPPWVLRPGAWTTPVNLWATPSVIDEHAPFERSFPPLHAGLVAWQPYDEDRLRFFARLGWVAALFGEEGLAPGVYVACWGEMPAPGDLTTARHVTDRSLHLWRVHPQPWVVQQPGLRLPAEVFTWDIKPLSGTVTARPSGVALSQGEHVIALESWMPIEVMTSKVELSPGLVFDTAETAMSVLQGTALSLYDWDKRAFDWVATDLSTVDLEKARYTGRYLSADGRALFKLTSLQGAVVLRAIKPTIETR